MRSLWVYDWEVYPNFACVTFLHTNTNPDLLDKYCELDIKYLKIKHLLKSNPDDESLKLQLDELFNGKRQVRTLLGVETFEFFNDNIDNKHHLFQLKEYMNFYSKYIETIGYNSYNYDSKITDAILANFNRFNNKGEVLGNITINHESIQNFNQFLYAVSQDVINNKDLFYNERSYMPKYYKRTYRDFDIQKITYLDKSYTGLKAVGITMKHHKLQELPYPFDEYLNYEQKEQIKDYNFNDDLITYKLVMNQKSELELRDKISLNYNVDVLNLSRSSIGKILMANAITQATGMPYKSFKDWRTYRGNMKLSTIIDDRIQFTTPKFQDLLKDLKTKTIYADKDEFIYPFNHNGTFYTIAKGGLHSIDDSRIYDSFKDGYIYRDADVTSYYPSILIIFGIHPKQFDKTLFLNSVRLFRDDRVEAKKIMKTLKNAIKEVHKKYDVIPDNLLADIAEANNLIDNNELKSEAFKIVINRIYGALRDINDFLYDPKATYQTTFNGELSILMLIEALEKVNGIHVISANTDGIVTQIKPEVEHLYKDICKWWEQLTNFELEYTDYEKYIRLDVNDYISIKKGYTSNFENIQSLKINDEIEYNKQLKFILDSYVKTKGSFNDEIAFNKGFVHPIVSIAIKRHFLFNEDYKDIIYNHYKTDKFAILDYAISQKVDKKFNVYAISCHNKIYKEEELQQYNRFIVTNTGSSIVKKEGSKTINLLKGKYVTIINDFIEVDYDINFKFYINKIEEMLYYKKKQSKGNHKNEGIYVRTINMFDNVD